MFACNVIDNFFKLTHNSWENFTENKKFPYKIRDGENLTISHILWEIQKWCMGLEAPFRYEPGGAKVTKFSCKSHDRDLYDLWNYEARRERDMKR